jgi:hypothetical protein
MYALLNNSRFGKIRIVASTFTLGMKYGSSLKISILFMNVL